MQRSYRTSLLAAFLLCWPPMGSFAGDDPPTPRAFEIVAMEPTPLRVPTYVATVPGVGLSGAQVSGIATLLTVWSQNAELSKQGAAASRALQEKLDAERVWISTVVVAQEFEKQLSARGYTARVNDGLAPFPTLKNRDYTYFGMPWSRAMRAWVNQPTAVSPARDPSASSGMETLEVGITSYEIFGDSLMLQVNAKLIDTKSGRVVRKSRAMNAFDMPSLAPIDQAFSEGGKGFKTAFATTAESLVAKCLDKLELRQVDNVGAARSTVTH